MNILLQTVLDAAVSGICWYICGWVAPPARGGGVWVVAADTAAPMAFCDRRCGWGCRLGGALQPKGMSFDGSCESCLCVVGERFCREGLYACLTTHAHKSTHTRSHEFSLASPCLRPLLSWAFAYGDVGRGNPFIGDWTFALVDWCAPGRCPSAWGAPRSPLPPDRHAQRHPLELPAPQLPATARAPRGSLRAR
jgi:hypothetical protein